MNRLQPKRLALRSAVWVAALGVGVLGVSHPALAQLRPDGSDTQTDTDYGVQFSQSGTNPSAARALAVKANRADGSSFYASANNIGNGYALTAGHAVVEGTSFSVSTGNNYLTNPGVVVTVASAVIRPESAGANSRGDIAERRLNGLYDTPAAR